MTESLAKLHEMTISSEKDVLEVIMYTDARLKPRGRAKGNRCSRSTSKTVITVLERVCYKMFAQCCDGTSAQKDLELKCHHLLLRPCHTTQKTLHYKLHT